MSCGLRSNRIGIKVDSGPATSARWSAPRALRLCSARPSNPRARYGASGRAASPRSTTDSYAGF
jgi:hypothetical protein